MEPNNEGAELARLGVNRLLVSGSWKPNRTAFISDFRVLLNQDCCLFTTDL
jgi:hypothetical protein